MKLSTRTRYGVQAVFDLAYHCVGRSCQIKRIAERQRISVRYLEQIFYRLKKTGIVRSERGPKGGYFLGWPPERITVGDIYRAVDGSLQLAPSGRRERSDMTSNVTELLWGALTKDVEKLFDSVTIESLCRKAGDMNIPREIEKSYVYVI